MDVIQNNLICGLGYEPPGTATVALFAIDTTATHNPKVQNNTVCPDPSAPPTTVASATTPTAQPARGPTASAVK